MTPSSIDRRTRLDLLLPAALLVAGTVTFLAGGRRHPYINASLGPVGSDEFYHEFARTIMHLPSWEGMHALILAGPVLWALGAAALVRLLPARAAALGEVGRAALTLAAVAWAVTFVFDGFIAPRLARGIVAAVGPAELAATLAPFKINQYIVARLGMVSMVLIGASVTAFALALLSSGRGARWRAAVGGIGILVGLWPLVAAASGEFAPGPFTSPYWNATAISVGLWFVFLATSLASLGRDEQMDHRTPALDTVAA